MLSQEEHAQRAGTSRTAVCAYEAGAKDTRAEAVERLLDAAGYRLELVPSPEWSTRATGRKSFIVASALPQLSALRAFATVELSHHLAWSGLTTFNLADRHERGRVYEIILIEGTVGDIEALVDGALLVDLWTTSSYARTSGPHGNR